ncbi:MAG: hypothetical protein WCC17_04700 [Candidatus Nitrosopolaris sp.]
MYKCKYVLISSALVISAALVMSVYVATTSFVMTMMPGNQTKGMMANLSGASNMTGASVKSDMTSAAKSMANSNK